jgi:adenine-specific DNA-methyltransferase
MAEDKESRFLSEQLVTYIGNKRALLPFIGSAVDIVRTELGREKLKIADLFSGSGAVSRYLKSFSSKLIVNDLETYCRVSNHCYLSNPSEIDLSSLKKSYRELIGELQKMPLREGIITKHYAPKDDLAIQPGERVFYTRRNALYLDTARILIDKLPEDIRHFFIAPLLSEASVHANTSGVFKGFYKDGETGIGRFGGTREDALKRIKGDISLPFPLFSSFECEVAIYQEDANALAGRLEPVDLVYLDPPYNQHPYGSNYFMLNLLADYREPGVISEVSGIPVDWNRSAYNRKADALDALEELVGSLHTRYLLVSFNSEGFIAREEMQKLLEGVGELRVMEKQYNTFRGSRNLRNRNKHVKEYLYLVKTEGELSAPV